MYPWMRASAERVSRRVGYASRSTTCASSADAPRATIVRPGDRYTRRREQRQKAPNFVEIELRGRSIRHHGLHPRVAGAPTKRAPLPARANVLIAEAGQSGWVTPHVRRGAGRVISRHPNVITPDFRCSTALLRVPIGAVYGRHRRQVGRTVRPAHFGAEVDVEPEHYHEADMVISARKVVPEEQHPG